MSRLAQWLDHRMEVVGLETWKDLSEYSGVPEDLLHNASVAGSLAVLDRSHRRWIATALRVSLRKLEQFDSGEIDGIRDDHVMDIDGRHRPLPRKDDDAAYGTPAEVPVADRGTPVVGHIRPDGAAEPDEDWQEEWGRHLPARFGKGYEIYALELDSLGHSVVFRNVPTWEFREGSAAVYSWNGWEARGLFGRVRLTPLQAVVVTPDGQRHELDLVNIVRIGKTIGRWPGDPRFNSVQSAPSPLGDGAIQRLREELGTEPVATQVCV
jgi:hypothetical protein